MAVLAQDVPLGIGTVLPFQVGRFEREMGVVMVHLVAGGAEVGLEVERGLDALVEPAAAAFLGLVRAALEKLSRRPSCRRRG